MKKDLVTVIKSINYGEADKILTVFSKYNGKMVLMAKGLRKINSKNRGNMQTLSTSEITYYEGRGMPILIESKLILSPNIDSKISTQNLSRLLFLLNKVLMEGDKNEILFDSLQSVLKADMSLEKVNKFRIKMLQESGFLKDFKTCERCKSNSGVKYFDVNIFGGLCESCYSKGFKGVKLGKEIYTDLKFSESLDRYIKKVIEEI